MRRRGIIAIVLSACAGVMFWSMQARTRRPMELPFAPLPDTLAPGATEIVTMRVIANQPTRLTVITPAEKSLRCRMVSHRDLLRVRRASKSSCALTVTTSVTGPFDVEIENPTRHLAPYAIEMHQNPQ